MDILFRTESCYGSGVRDITDIMEHEIFELGNMDIPEYLLKNHKKLLSKNSQTLLSCKYLYSTNLLDSTKRKLCECIIADLNKATGKSYKYGLWLADKDIVKELYDGNDTNIDAYEVSDMKISDLGKDGALYLYEEFPIACLKVAG